MVKNSIEHLLKDGMKIIKKRDYNNPFLDLQLILMKLIDKDKLYLLMHPEEVVSQDIVDKYYDMVKKRNDGYPLQYMLGHQEFMGLDFYVEEGVLIPRPDTETLVEKVINIVNNTDKLKNRSLKILDIGTGSGAIALSLAYNLKNSYVTAVDISDIALKVTNINRENFNLTNVNLVKGNLFGDLNIDNDKFDIIVSNPPYIEKHEIDFLQTEVSVYEPRLALDGGEDGLIYYKKIAQILNKCLMPEGMLFLEIGNKQADDVSKIIAKTNLFNNIEVVQDLYENDRVIVATNDF